jgi:hypothetical protein
MRQPARAGVLSGMTDKSRKRSVPGASAGEGGEWVAAVVGGEQFAEVGE